VHSLVRSLASPQQFGLPPVRPTPDPVNPPRPQAVETASWSSPSPDEELSADRSYRRALNAGEARAERQRDVGARFDAAVVDEHSATQATDGVPPLGDRLGEPRGDLEPVGNRHRDLLAGGPLGDADADLLGEGELAAEVVRPLGRDAEIGADGGDPVRPMESGAGLPAAANCRCWSESVSSSRCWQRAWCGRSPRSSGRPSSASRSQTASEQLREPV